MSSRQMLRGLPGFLDAVERQYVGSRFMKPIGAKLRERAPVVPCRLTTAI